MSTYLISEAKVKATGLIQDNFDPTYLKGVIVIAQDLYLQPALGTKLYKAILSKVQEGTVSGMYKTLLDDYIQPFLIQRVLSDVQVSVFAKFRNAGMVQSQDTQTAQLSRSDVEYIRNYYDKQAVFYQNRMTDYLTANAASFPEWLHTDSVADMQATSNNTKAGIYLGRR